MEKKKEEHIQQTIEELARGNLDIIEQSFVADYIAHAGDKEYSGHSFLKRFTNQLRTALSDLRVVKITFLAQDVHTIAWQRTLSGTHNAAMQSIPASGKKVIWVDMVVTRFENEKIAEEWIVSELMGELLLKVPQK